MKIIITIEDQEDNKISFKMEEEDRPKDENDDAPASLLFGATIQELFDSGILAKHVNVFLSNLDNAKVQHQEGKTADAKSEGCSD